MMNNNERAKEAQRRVEMIKPMLAGQEPEIVGAILADLVAILLVGHRCSTPEATAELREEILRMHIELVRHLIPINEAMMMESELSE
jgi:hypothetical protein